MCWLVLPGVHTSSPFEGERRSGPSHTLVVPGLGAYGGDDLPVPTPGGAEWLSGTLANRACGGRGGRDALEGKGPQRGSQARLGRRLEEVAKAVGGGYCRLQMPLRLALAIRGTVAGHRLGALEGGGGGTSPSSNAALRGGAQRRGLGAWPGHKSWKGQAWGSEGRAWGVTPSPPATQKYQPAHLLTPCGNPPPPPTTPAGRHKARCQPPKPGNRLRGGGGGGSPQHFGLDSTPTAYPNTSPNRISNRQ